MLSFPLIFHPERVATGGPLCVETLSASWNNLLPSRQIGGLSSRRSSSMEISQLFFAGDSLTIVEAIFGESCTTGFFGELCTTGFFVFKNIAQRQVRKCTFINPNWCAAPAFWGDFCTSVCRNYESKARATSFCLFGRKKQAPDLIKDKVVEGTTRSAASPPVSLQGY